MNNDESQKTIRHPEWREALDAMRKQGVTYGSEFPLEFFTSTMRLDPVKDEMRFQLSMSKIREELETEGLYLSGEGGKGLHWRIIRPEENASIVLRRQNDAIRSLHRGVILGSNTKTDGMDDHEKRKLESITERCAHRLVLMKRSEEIKLPK